VLRDQVEEVYQMHWWQVFGSGHREGEMAVGSATFGSKDGGSITVELGAVSDTDALVSWFGGTGG
jgi:hypothetical protein